MNEPKRWPFALQAKCPTCGKPLGAPGHVHTCSPQLETFCDANCVWTDHHPNCALAQPKSDVEAIVRECAKVIEDHYEPVYDGEILLKHFGLAR